MPRCYSPVERRRNKPSRQACNCCPNETLSPRLWHSLQQICFRLVHETLRRPRSVTRMQMVQASTLLHWTNQDHLMPLLKQAVGVQDAHLFRRIIRALLAVLVYPSPHLHKARESSVAVFRRFFDCNDHSSPRMFQSLCSPPLPASLGFSFPPFLPFLPTAARRTSLLVQRPAVTRRVAAPVQTLPQTLQVMTMTIIRFRSSS